MRQFTKGNNNIQNITVINTQKTVTINGRTYKGPVRIENNKIIYNDGTSTIDEKVINVIVNGNVDSIETITGTVTVTGNVTQAQTASGDIKVSGDTTNATTMSGDITAKKIDSATSMSGDVNIK